MRFIILQCLIVALNGDYSSQIRPDPSPEINFTITASHNKLRPSDDQLSSITETVNARNVSDGRRIITQIGRDVARYCVRGIRVAGLCLSFSYDKKNKAGAIHACDKNHGVLATITNAIDQTELEAYISRNYDRQDGSVTTFWYNPYPGTANANEEKDGYICNLDVSNTCKTKYSCALQGGTCVAGKGCRGRIVSGGCKGKYCKCCLPECPTTAGFFISPGQQCMKFFGDIRRTWFQARDKCQLEGLIMAEPFDPVGLNSNVLGRYGCEARCFLGARGDGKNFVWLSDGQTLYNNNPWWRPPMPGIYVTPDRCLVITMADSILDKPYWSTFCSTHHSDYPKFALCEMVIN